jgi:ATP-binding protein involved in chromosome partitioning
MTITPKQILQALSHVDDPDLHKDLVSLGMIRNIQIDGLQLAFDLVLTTPACPMKEMLERACITAIHHFISAQAQVTVNIKSEVRNNNALNSALSNVKNVIAIASGKGGVGKSTVAVSLAKILSLSGAKVGLLDADIYGPSQAILTGTTGYKPDSVASNDGRNLMTPADVDGVKVFSIGYLVQDKDPIAWRGPMLSSAIKQFVQDVKWGELDYLLVDMPPGTGDVQITLSQAITLTGAIIVTTPQEIAVADARRALNMFRMKGLEVPVLGIIENMAWFQTPQLPDQKFYIFGQNGGTLLSQELNVPYLGAIPLFENLPGPIEAKGNIWNQNPSIPFLSDIAGNMVRQLAVISAKPTPQNLTQ